MKDGHLDVVAQKLGKALSEKSFVFLGYVKTIATLAVYFQHPSRKEAFLLRGFASDLEEFAESLEKEKNIKKVAELLQKKSFVVSNLVEHMRRYPRFHDKQLKGDGPFKLLVFSDPVLGINMLETPLAFGDTASQKAWVGWNAVHQVYRATLKATPVCHSIVVSDDKIEIYGVFPSEQGVANARFFELTIDAQTEIPTIRASIDRVNKSQDFRFVSREEMAEKLEKHSAIQTTPSLAPIVGQRYVNNFGIKAMEIK